MLRFNYKLARELGCSVQSLDDLTIDELQYWFAYFKHEPFTFEQTELDNAAKLCIAVNAAGGKSKQESFIDQYRWMTDEEKYEAINNPVLLTDDTIKIFQEMQQAFGG